MRASLCTTHECTKEERVRVLSLIRGLYSVLEMWRSRFSWSCLNIHFVLYKEHHFEGQYWNFLKIDSSVALCLMAITVQWVCESLFCTGHTSWSWSERVEGASICTKICSLMWASLNISIQCGENRAGWIRSLSVSIAQMQFVQGFTRTAAAMGQSVSS